MEHKYILLKDSDGYENLWEIIEENERSYTVQRCGTVDYIHSGLCWEVDESSILRTNIIIDFSSKVNIEDENDNEEYYAEHEKFMDCECFNCWMIGYDDEGLI